MKNLNVLVTGGAGYIGSHTVLSLLEQDYSVSVVDNLCNGNIESLRRVENITKKKVNFFEGDVRDPSFLKKIFFKHHFDYVIHFAGLKAVSESIKNPAEYYDVNFSGTLNLITAMQLRGCNNLVFSSSATVYGQNASVPYVESLERGDSTSPYGSTKSSVENFLEELSVSSKSWSIINLRYFNPIGAHLSGEIGEDPNGVPNNLLPFISQVAVGARKKLQIFGGDYQTPDGTCRRDYIHVMDLAEGHVAALKHLKKPGCESFNLGSGVPYSVLEIVNKFELISGVRIPYEITDRRSGDLDEFWADASKANNAFKWKATRSLNEMIADTWRWQSKNPKGY